MPYFEMSLENGREYVYQNDASVVEAAGIDVELAEGNRENIKITTPFDLIVAEALCRSRVWE